MFLSLQIVRNFKSTSVVCAILGITSGFDDCGRKIFKTFYVTLILGAIRH